MDALTRQKFEQMWKARVPLAVIATTLGYSFSTLAKLRMIYGLEKRYGADDDQQPPSPEVIRLRCLAQQTNWTPTERKMRWQGVPHTIYDSRNGYDEP
jgi:hypothetical protein